MGFYEVHVVGILRPYNALSSIRLHVMGFLLHFFRVQEHGGEPIIPFSCALERNLADMPADEAAKYCEENKLQR